MYPFTDRYIAKHMRRHNNSVPNESGACSYAIDLLLQRKHEMGNKTASLELNNEIYTPIITNRITT